MNPIFVPSMLRGRAIHVIGQGSLGGAVTENLFRMQVPELHLWDYDIVEARNRFNQRVFAEDIGAAKLHARQRILRAIYPEGETNLVLHNARVVYGTQFAGIVICCADPNRVRYKEVWPNVKENPRVTFFADGRVGFDGGKAFGLDPNNPNHILHYEDSKNHNHPDPPHLEEQAACKSEFPMPQNADSVAAEVAWRMIRWLHLEHGCDDPYDNFVGWQWIPRKSTVTEQWDQGTVRFMVTEEVSEDAE